MTNSPAAPPQKTEQRRQQILEAACDCARRAGFHGASMADIAKAAGLSVGQIYRYFESKDALIAAIVACGAAEMRQRFADKEKAGAADETLMTQCKQSLDWGYDPERAGLALEVMAEAARNETVAQSVRVADETKRALVREALQKVGALDGVSSAELDARVEVLLMIVEGMVMRSVLNPKSDHDEIVRVLQAVWRLLLSNAPLTAR